MPPYREYAIGQTVILEGKTTNDDGEPIPPVDPRVLLKSPDGTETSLTVEFSDVVGTWGHELLVTGPAGFYSYRLVQSNDAFERLFYVKGSAFAAPLG